MAGRIPSSTSRCTGVGIDAAFVDLADGDADGRAIADRTKLLYASTIGCPRADILGGFDTGVISAPTSASAVGSTHCTSPNIARHGPTSTE